MRQRNLECRLEKIRIMIVAPEFDTKTIKAAQVVEPHVILVKYIVGVDKDGNKYLVPQVIFDNTTATSVIEPPWNIDDHFRGKEHMRQLYNRLASIIDEIAPEKEVRPRKGYIGFLRKGRLFCIVEVQKNALKVAMPMPADEKWGYTKIYSGDEIDDELKEWIKLAYERVGEG